MCVCTCTHAHVHTKIYVCPASSLYIERDNLLHDMCGIYVTGNEAHYSIIKQGQYVHLDDLCESHIFLYEHPKAEGRYICSSHDAVFYDLVTMIAKNWPEYNLLTDTK